MIPAPDPRPAPGPVVEPASSPLVGLLVAVALVVASTVGALALGSRTPAAAVGLVRFESCEALEAWAVDAVGRPTGGGRDDAGDVGVEDASPDAAPPAPGRAESALGEAAADGQTAGSGTGAGSGDADTGGTNTVVEGVDEVDLVDRIDERRVLVAADGTLSLVDLAARRRLASVGGLPFDARITHEGGVVFAAGTDDRGMGAVVQRIRVAGDGLVHEGTWTTSGVLLDARRTRGRLHVVAVDQRWDGQVPFPDRPVACDEVWRPVAPTAEPAATLVASFGEQGPLTPVAAAEVAGTAGNVLVTGDALYVATASWGDGEGPTSGIHRFDLAALTPTGSGVVPGFVAGPFAMSEHGGHLRVATDLGGGAVGSPMPVDVDFGVGDGAGAPTVEPVTFRQVDVSSTTEPGEPTTTEPEVTTTTEPEVTTTTEPEVTTTTEPEATTTTTEPEPTTTSSTTSTSTTATTEPVPDAPPDALAEVFVLDLEGDLDVVGRTGRFGHDYETIHGVRFVGDVAYVVTFLQTDPFWVVDLADPAAPRVVGELQIPGFSAYLHPVADGRVVGFGPDGRGAISARLFDVADATRPTVVDEVRLGDDSPIVWDHHAFVGLGGDRFAVPVTDDPTYVIDPVCETIPVVPDDGGVGDEVDRPGLPGAPPPVPCEQPEVRGGGSGAAVLEVRGGRLAVVERALVDGVDLQAQRVLPGPDGTWWVLGYDRLVGTDGSVLPVGG